VADKPNWAKQAGVTPGKLALIGVLAVALVGVLYLQYGPTTKRAPTTTLRPPAEPESAASPARATSPADAAHASATAPRKKTGAITGWQSPELGSIVQYDPFALPTSFPQPRQIEVAGATSPTKTAEEASAQQAALAEERTKSETELQGLRQQGVQAILRRDDQYVAIVGDHEVHVGDQINGFTVIAIDADGVRLAKDLNP
jgi:hypothetical protein